MTCHHRFDDYDVILEGFSPHCTFPVAEERLISFAGKRWCPYHLPMWDEAGNPSPKARWNPAAVQAFNDEVTDHIHRCYRQGGIIDLSGVVFPGGIQLRHCFTGQRPESHVLFGGAVFHGVADFQDCHFSWWVRFDGARFLAGGNFHGVRFRFTSFRGVLFQADALFLRSDFTEFADFRRSRFSGNAIFEGDPGRELGCRFQDVSFEGAVFEGRANFNNRLFQNSTDFSRAVFVRAPEFHNSRLHQDFRCDEARFEDLRSAHAPGAYRTLRLAMGRIHDRALQSLFFSLEWRSRHRRGELRGGVRVVSALYGLISDHGRCLTRPLAGLLALPLFFLPVYALVAGAAGLDPPWVELFRFSVEQMLRPFAVWSDIQADGASSWLPGALIRFPIALRGLALVQSLAGITFFLLFLLAVRRRFSI